MKTVDVNLAERSYQIHIGSGLVPRAADFIAPLLKRHRVAIVTDENVAKRFMLSVLMWLPPSWRFCVAITVAPKYGNNLFFPNAFLLCEPAPIAVLQRNAHLGDNCVTVPAGRRSKP